MSGPNPSHRAVFFDFDGLILDTETPEVKSWQWMFSEFGLEYPEAFWRNHIGRGPDQVLETPGQLLKRLSGCRDSEADLFAKFRARYWELLKIECQPGARELIEELAGLGVRLFIVSSSSHGWVDDFLEKLGLLGFFERTICCEDAPRSKPAPDLYLTALAESGLDASRVWAIEDSFNGMSAALAAGIRVLVIPNWVTQQQDLSAATLRLGSLSEAGFATFFENG